MLENIPKICHMYWDGSNFSYLNYLAAKTFKDLNPTWKIIVHMPIKKTVQKRWTTSEQKAKYTGKNYFQLLDNINDLEIRIVDFNVIGFDNNVSEVIKSDYLRYQLLSTIGGIWSDFDIIYMKSLDIISTSNWKTIGDKNNINTVIIKAYSGQSKRYYYPIGFLMASKNNAFFKHILSLCNKNLNESSYQSIGAKLLKKVMKSNYNRNGFNCLIMDHTSYLPLQWYNVKEIYHSKNIYKYIKETTFGIHWFNGSTISKKFMNNFDKNPHTGNTIIYNYINQYIKKDFALIK